MRVLVACSHGTADEDGTAAVTGLAEAVGRHGVPMAQAHVDVHGPYVGDVVAEHEGRVVVVPLLLAEGYHVRVDVAAAVAGWPEAQIAPALGPDDRVTEVLLERMAQAGARRDDAVLLAAAGSSDDTAEVSVRDTAAALARAWGAPVGVAYGAAREPRVADEVARLRDERPGRRVVAVSYLLATGHFHRTVVAAGADVVTEPLLGPGDPDDRLVDLVLSRYADAVATRTAQDSTAPDWPS